MLTDSKRTGEFIQQEAPGTISRDTVTVTVAAGTTLLPGTVLAQLAGSGKYVQYDNVGSDGSETAAGILYAALDNDDGVAPVDFDGVVINFCAEVRVNDLVWADGVDQAAGLADLRTRFIKARPQLL